MGIGRAELMILLGAIAIFGRFILTINTARFNTEFRVIAGEAQYVSASIAESVIDEASIKAFDQATTTFFLHGGISGLTDPSFLGPETGELYPNFNDIDDYHGLMLSDTVSNGIQYTITASVGYVDENDWETILNEKKLMKRLNVTVFSEHLPDTITLSRVFSYYYQ